MRIGDKVRYNKKFLKLFSYGFKEDEYAEYHEVGIIVGIKKVSDKILLCTVKFPQVEKKILNSNLVKFSEKEQLFLD